MGEVQSLGIGEGRKVHKFKEKRFRFQPQASGHMEEVEGDGSITNCIYPKSLSPIFFGGVWTLV